MSTTYEKLKRQWKEKRENENYLNNFFLYYI